MRSKEEAYDYRYFPDPDLLPVHISEDFKAQIKAQLPELPDAKKLRFRKQYGLNSETISILVSSRQMADFYEETFRNTLCNADDLQVAKICANWITGEILSRLNKEGKDIAECPVNALDLGRLLKKVRDNEINADGAKIVLDELWVSLVTTSFNQDVKVDVTFTTDAGRTSKISNGIPESNLIDEIIAEKGLKQITDTGAIEAVIDQIIANNAKQVEQYLAGNEKVFGFFVGQVMKEMQGKANPAEVNKMLKTKLIPPK